MTLSLPKIVILAVVQGLTEFLPVSSSGHLVIAAQFLAQDGQASTLDIGDLNVVLHAGTLISILIVYFRRLVKLLGEDRRLVSRLVLATIPAVIVGVPIKEFAENVLSDPLLAGCLLVATGLMLLVASRLTPGTIDCRDISSRQALLMGLSQALAILPGLSRSGATISTGLALRLQPASAATFSFLMAIPVIGGASLLEIVSLARDPQFTTPVVHLAIGSGVSCAVGLASLTWVIRWIERGRLQWFAAWCIPVGLTVIVWQLGLMRA